MTFDIGTLRRQLQQLKALHDSGDLGDATYERSRAELERKLVEQVMAGGEEAVSPSAAATPRPSWGLLGGIGVGVVLLAALGYWWAGSPDMARRTALASGSTPTGDANGNAANPHSASTEQIAEMADKLATRLKDKPDDLEGWAMLARSYSVLGRHNEAVPAYRKAVALRGDDAQLLADFADALAVASNRDLGGEAGELVARALKLEPDNLKALSLAGTAAFDRKDYAAAVKLWERIVAVAPADSIYLSQVQASLTEARELGKLPPAPGAAASAAKASPTQVKSTTAIAAEGASVSGTVTLAAALQGRAGADDTVFVFARPVDGSRMPVAILRKQVKDLPLDFKLDDSLAMSPAAKLSAYKQVVVGARVSKSGDAMPQPGDLSALSAPVVVGTRGLKLEIAPPAGK